MKRSLLIVFILLAVFSLNVSNAFGQALLDTRLLSAGAIGVQYSPADTKPVKVMIEKDGTQYTYDLNGKKENFSLQMGSGPYTVSLLENVEGNKYRVMSRETVSVTFAEEKDAFLCSVQMINWNSSMEAIEKAGELVRGAKNDREKAERIYRYVVDNIAYDHHKANKVTKEYLPEIETVFNEGKGICYDYASLFAAMLRSAGVPAKLAAGYAQGVKEYHAWNEVYLEGQWVVMDTAVDAQYIRAGHKTDMVKNSGAYNKVKEY